VPSWKKSVHLPRRCWKKRRPWSKERHEGFVGGAMPSNQDRAITRSVCGDVSLNGYVVLVCLPLFLLLLYKIHCTNGYAFS
jgi:hypothetical protein